MENLHYLTLGRTTNLQCGIGVGRINRSMEQTGPEIDLHLPGQLTFGKDAKAVQQGKKVPPTTGEERLGLPPGKNSQRFIQHGPQTKTSLSQKFYKT